MLSAKHGGWDMNARELAFGIAGLIIGIALLSLWRSGPSTYEECMLDKMRNQHDIAVFNHARTLCEHLPRKAAN